MTSIKAALLKTVKVVTKEASNKKSVMMVFHNNKVVPASMQNHKLNMKDPVCGENIYFKHNSTLIYIVFSGCSIKI